MHVLACVFIGGTVGRRGRLSVITASAAISSVTDLSHRSTITTYHVSPLA